MKKWENGELGDWEGWSVGEWSIEEEKAFSINN